MAADRTSSGFGATLRDARERRGVSLRQIANATKISVAALEALERNDISRLPGGIFSRSFVRSYAIEVGLDPEATIQAFIAQFPNDSVTAGHPTSGQVEDNESLESDRRMAGTFLWLLMISVPVAGTLVYFATAGRRAPAPEPAPAAVAAPPPETRPAVDLPPPAADVAPAAAVTPPPASSSPSQKPAAASPAASPSAGPPSAAPPAVAPPSAAAVASAAAPKPPATAAAPAGDHLTVSLTARRPCWVSATVDGKKEIERLLQPGEHQTIEVRREMVLTAGDASAIALTFNGADARPLGKAGDVVTARFNLTNFKDYLQVR